MLRTTSSLTRSAIAALGLATVVAACSDSNNNNVTNPISPLNVFKQTNLVADAAGGGATTVDPNLVNPWGLAFGSTGVLWVSNNQTGTSTLYDSLGTKKSTTVTIPGAGTATTGAPTGVIFNSTTDFVIPSAGPALFIFAGEDGSITAWNSSTGSVAQIVADRSSNSSVYKGLAMAANSGANFLYATDFKNNHVDVFDRTFTFVKSFTDAGVPAGYGPFGIANIGGQLFVTYAKQEAPDDMDDEPGVGNGFVDVFNPDGTLSRRFASNGKLNSPWAIALAPSNFGAFSGDILIGNFGDGLIGAYDPTTGSFVDVLRDSSTNPIAIDGLWSLTFGPSAGSTKLYFAAGPDKEAHGLLGTLTPP